MSPQIAKRFVIHFKGLATTAAKRVRKAQRLLRSQSGEWRTFSTIRNDEGKDVDKFITVPFMFGVRIDLHEHVSISGEWGWRATFSDYLDDVSQNGNPNRNDWYLFVGGSVSYFFGSFSPDFFKGKEY